MSDPENKTVIHLQDICFMPLYPGKLLKSQTDFTRYHRCNCRFDRVYQDILINYSNTLQMLQSESLETIDML